ncbi:MAG: hypothetical protein HYW97_01975 [Candidatus Wildermuthbacteria bacterium]|nr:hypothetical protein [Candidatus Wildermuthbacteria bacterium]
MTTKPETAFDIVEGVTDPKIALLATVLSGLPKEKQIGQITETFFRTWTQENTELLDPLERLFGNDKVAFRTHLRSLYKRCVGAHLSTGYYRPEAQRHIMQKVLKGWNWERIRTADFFKDNAPKLEMRPDASECFEFFVEAFLQARNKEVEDSFLKCLRQHIDHLGAGWDPEDLDWWILKPSLPSEILEVLLHARIRLGGPHLLQAELQFLHTLDFHKRSREAMPVVRQFVEQVRRTDELASMIVEKLRPFHTSGELNRYTPLEFLDKVDWTLETPQTAHIHITFASTPNPATLKAVRDTRDWIIVGTGDREISILISAHGPEGDLIQEV